MGIVTIDYHYLGNMITQAQYTCTRVNDYSREIDKQFINKLSSLEGDDAAGNISTAMSLARDKKNKLSGYDTNFRKLREELSNLSINAADADRAVKNKINSLAKPYEEKQKWYQKVGSFVYGLFCDVGDFLSETYLGEIFVNAISKSWTMLKMVKDFVSDWFKYGAGKYVANILLSVVAVIGVVTAMVGAIVGAPVVLAVTALVAGTIALVYALGNMIVSVEQNSKAMEYHKQGKLGMARYYGAQTTVRTWTERTDFGGEAANKIAEVRGSVYDVVGKAATYVLTACSVVNGIYQLKAVKSRKTGEIIRYQKTYNKDGKITNVIKNNLRDKLKWKGWSSIFGKSKSYALSSYEGSKNFLSLISTTTGTTLQLLGGKSSTMEDIDKAVRNPSLSTITKAIKSTVGNFFMPDYVQSNGKFFLPTGLTSDIINLYESERDLCNKIWELKMGKIIFNSCKAEEG